jgi:hypothetical protein
MIYIYIYSCSCRPPFQDISIQNKVIASMNLICLFVTQSVKTSLFSGAQKEKLEKTDMFQTHVDYHRTTWLYIPEIRAPHSHRCQNFTSSNNININENLVDL